MPTIKINPILFGVLFFSLVQSVSAQYHEVGLSVGVLNYKGELSPEVHPGNFRPGTTLFYRYNFNPDISFKAGLTLGQLSGDDKNWNLPLNNYRNSMFSTILIEPSGMFEFNFFSYRKAKGGMDYTVYLTGGVAAYYFQTRRGSPIMPALPVGIGFKYAFLKQFNFGAEFVNRFLFSDQLDGVSDVSNYAKQGNPNDVDMYLYGGVWVSYTFYDVNCPGHYVW